jgi:hypothetical protein
MRILSKFKDGICRVYAWFLILLVVVVVKALKFLYSKPKGAK